MRKLFRHLSAVLLREIAAHIDTPQECPVCNDPEHHEHHGPEVIVTAGPDPVLLAHQREAAERAARQ